jgi:transcriptional regulator with XRE-family HTH domain
MEQKIRRDLNLGTNLRRLRDSFGISQEKLCAELQRRGCDIGRTTYAKYESGELNIRASVIVELKKYYNCSYDDFFEGLDKYKDYMIEFFTKEQKKVYDYDKDFIEKCVEGFKPIMGDKTHDEYLLWRDQMVTRTRMLKEK